jgi:hypothetical protein
MQNEVSLFIEAQARNMTQEIPTVIQQIAHNSVATLVEAKQEATQLFSATLHTTSDKLESLVYKCAQAGLMLALGATDILTNAATQYSGYRDIYVHFLINAR